LSVSFESQADAEKVRRLLLDGGYDEKDVHVMDRASVPGHRPGAAEGNAFLLVGYVSQPRMIGKAAGRPAVLRWTWSATR